ncbi:TenA family transcriptional regulator [Sinimarinibacterium sp. CAU 1509]|uniref:TenA family transcriptional regulator n=1 Tax=Sinimarinibacterium sp. CAU 1509 TaxID=2562283 RepID=UPI00146F25F3|nr:iron-containing redox enzyme family protein [Sinimarinibacterium sp. CAU 1509]
MGRFEQVVEACREDYVRHIATNPLIQMLGEGRVSREHYAAYLVQTFHLVRHTSRTLALGAARCDDRKRALRAWFIEQAGEEHGHELFCLKDLRNLGVDAEAAVAAPAGPGASGLFTQNYFLASYGNPVAILGVASATEGMGAEIAGGFAQMLVQRYGIPEAAVTFLRSHAGFDQKHLVEARRAIEEFVTSDADFDDVVHARRMTYHHYGQMFRDVAEGRVPLPTLARAA